MILVLKKAIFIQKQDYLNYLEYLNDYCFKRDNITLKNGHFWDTYNHAVNLKSC